ncbi:hypothetical protein SAMN04489712_113131 [Thermomonospora echinospora]|uniref:Uncharacterized protein n=1 Tax=Thermomonospora echinospora TaxID=1992 RepID=A0A1H6D5N0_9ACTN|nr:hypothetical protein [Thermomonospora echinospora]SEG80687.1 hypothetical protein SAMN04489712_113131 [Thermomonospora echinospora]
MKAPVVHQHPQLHARVCSVLNAALRADNTAIDTVVQLAEGLDAHTADFLRHSRRLVLACAAALSSVLDIHQPVTEPDAPRVCRECGGHQCRTLNNILNVLDAYAARPGEIDRAEAWRRADHYFNARGGPTSLVAVDTFEDGYVARAFTTTTTAEPAGPLLVIDRRTGRLSAWPPMPRQTLIEQYRRYLDGLL